jgi:hippurate hydrolase
MKHFAWLLLLGILGCSTTATSSGPAAPLPPSRADDLNAPIFQAVDAEVASLFELYKWFHANPELSLKEEKTAAKFAGEVRAAGWAVTEGIGGTGVVAVLKNGPGPTVLARIDMDGLPVKEETGLPYASTNGAMHACGHDTHLAIGIGFARTLGKLKNRWSGTAILVGQPAEEVGLGAKRMIEDPKFAGAIPSTPVACLSVHDSPAFPAGTVALCPGYSSANADSIDIRIFGRGGHGAWPHETIDPVVMAAEMVLAFQTIVSRKTDPLANAVVTVGSIHGGSKHNIIPNEVALQLTVRSYDDKVRDKLLSEIRHIALKIAEANHAPKPPEIKMEENYFPAVYHDPALTERLRTVFARMIGTEKTLAAKPAMGAEDFGRFCRHFGAPGIQFNVGAAPATVVHDPPPGLHSAKWAPDPEPTLRIGTASLVRGCLDLLGTR